MGHLEIATNLSTRRRKALLAVAGDLVFLDVPRDAPWEVPDGARITIQQASGWPRAPRDCPAGWPGALEWLHFVSAGVDAYPSWALMVPTVTCGRHVNSVPIAEYAMAAIMAVEKPIGASALKSPDRQARMALGMLEGKTLGLFGFGAIGNEIATRARAFGMKVIVARRREGSASQSGVRLVAGPAELMSCSDHLVICAPLTAQTRGIFDAGLFAHAKPGLHLVNIARGGLIDEAALLAALDDGRVSRATLDVLQQEPPAPDDPLVAHPNTLVTPHISWQGGDTDARIAARIAANLARWRNGEPLADVVDVAAGY